MVARSQDQEPVQMTETEYLAFDATSETKNEFVNGEVYAMTGASWNHNVICQNTATALANQLGDRACTVVSSDMRLHIATKSAYRYPDVMVICGEPEFIEDRADTINNPIIIVEVLSPATALVDRNEKLDEYTRVPSLQAYVLIAQDEAKVERYRRHESGEWLYSRVTGIDASLELPSLDCILELAAIYSQIISRN